MKRGHRFIHYFLHDMKFKNKFMITHLFLVLVPTLAVLVLLYGRLSHIITTNAIASEQALVSQTANTLEATVSQIEMAMNTLQFNPLLSRTPFSGELYASLCHEPERTDARELYGNIDVMLKQNFITAIRIYLPDIDLSGGPEEMAGDYNFHDSVDFCSSITGSYWHGIFNGSPQTNFLYCPAFYLTNAEIDNLGSLAYIHRLDHLVSPEGEYGYVAIYFSAEYLQSILLENLTETNSMYYLINSRNSIVTSSDPGLAGTYFMRYETIPDVIGSQQEFSTVKVLEENLYMGYRDIGHTDWRLVSAIPVKGAIADSRKVLLSTLSLYLIFIIMAGGTALLFSRSIARRISLVVEKMNEQRGLSPVRFAGEADRDEIGQLIYNYNLMVDRINQLMTEQHETAEKLKVSEVNALQAQINPHFLYNMLDMVNWLARDGKQKEVSLAVQTLSKFYRLTLSKKNIMVPIGRELQHVELYVQLQNMRYEDKISFIIDVPDDILDCEIPKLVLQPVVENSIQHGIFEKDSMEGTIVIMAWMEEGDIIFVVSDDGMGIPPEKLPHILTGESQGGGSNIGIYNTHLRLQLIYGEKYGLHYESIYGKGTEVAIRIPAKNAPE